jgi:TRAP-type C4-dicarboxylate transport system permease small subunit
MNFLRTVDRVSLVVNKIAVNATVILFTTMTLIVWMQIFFRFILGGGLAWTEEIAKYLMVWMALLGASILFRDRGHIAINFFISRFSFLRYILIFHAVVAAVLFVLLVYYGTDYAIFGLKSISPASGIKKFWPYLSIPVGGFFLLIQALSRIIHLLCTDNKSIKADEDARARHEILAVAE